MNRHHGAFKPHLPWLLGTLEAVMIFCSIASRMRLRLIPPRLFSRRPSTALVYITAPFWLGVHTHLTPDQNLDADLFTNFLALFKSVVAVHFIYTKIQRPKL